MQTYLLFLLPFALCAAFPRSDYYGSSALGVAHLRPSRRAQFRYRAGDPSSRVLISNLCAVRRRALPLAILKTDHESCSRLGRVDRAQQQGWTYPAASDRFASNAITIKEALSINSEASVTLFVVSS
jgi:hypothetical protein